MSNAYVEVVHCLDTPMAKYVDLSCKAIFKSCKRCVYIQCRTYFVNNLYKVIMTIKMNVAHKKK